LRYAHTTRGEGLGIFAATARCGMGWRELCLLVVCLAAWRGAALAAAAAPSWNCTSLDRVPQAFFAQRSELAVNATTPLAAGAHASFACLQVLRAPLRALRQVTAPLTRAPHPPSFAPTTTSTSSCRTTT
jgi:hypothetical protein